MSEAETLTETLPETLADLMSRLERRRRHYQQQHDYVRLVAVGLVFILVPLLLTLGTTALFLPVLLLILTPYFLAMYRVPQLRLTDEFMSGVMPFYLKEHGAWVHELHSAHFPTAELRQSRLVGTQFALSQVVHGVRSGTPVAMAEVAMVKPGRRRLGVRPEVETGWVVGCKPFGLPPVSRAEELPEAWQVKLAKLPAGARVAVSSGVIWVWVPGPRERYGAIALKMPLNERAPYDRVKAALAESFALIGQLVPAA